MLTFQGGGRSYCDGVKRRDFLRIGGLAMGGLALPGLFAAEAVAGVKATGKSIINIYLGGGPTHMDTFDLKPKAPAEYRGEFNPIATNAPGLEICELMPELASVGDKFSVIRSITGLRNEHNAKQSESGWDSRSLTSIGGRPGIGSVMSKVWGASQPTTYGSAPTNVDLTGWTKPGFAGQIHAAYRPSGEGRSNLSLNNNVPVSRLDDRRALLSGLDRLKRDVDASGMMDAVDSFTDRAVGIVTSGRLADALDYKKDDPRIVDRYGINERRDTERFLVSRRLIQAGVRCVSFSWGGWDTHGNNFTSMRTQLPPLSRALATLIEDLDVHGLLDDTIIMMSGEFGRTPRINGNAGRDHWNRAGFFFLAGGGMRHGQAIGATNPKGEEAQDRPVHLQNVFTTVYHQLGINPETTQLVDPNGRPQYLVEEREVIRELV